VEVKRWREIEGERISWGRGEARRLGRVECRIWSAGILLVLGHMQMMSWWVDVMRHTLSKLQRALVYRLDIVCTIW